MGGAVALLALGLLAGRYDPEVDLAHGPWNGLSLGLGVQRLQDEFGLSARVASPRFLDDRLCVALAGGLGFYPDLRALPQAADEQDFGAWSTYGHARLTLEVAVPIAFSSGRLYAAVGPSVLVLSAQLSQTQLAPGVVGLLGVELFAGDALSAYPFALYLEIGAGAHAAAADVENRTGRPVATDTTIDRPIGTGLALGGGVRFYLWR